METCQPTPADIKATAVARLRNAVDELNQAARALSVLPSLTSAADEVRHLSTVAAAIADQINPFA